MSRAYEFSPEWRKRRAKIRKRQEDRWAAKASPVVVTKVEPRPPQSGERSSPE
jgi:hypothetical protein